MNFGKELKEMREAKKLTTKELAKELKITEILLVRLENGTSKPTDEIKKKVEKLFKVPEKKTENKKVEKKVTVKKDEKKSTNKKVTKKKELKEKPKKTETLKVEVKEEKKPINKKVTKKEEVQETKVEESIKVLVPNVEVKEEKKEEKPLVKEEPKTKKDFGKPCAKAIYVLARIMKVVLYIALPFIALAIVLLPSVLSRVSVSGNTISFRAINEDVFTITGENLSLNGSYQITYNDKIISDDIHVDVMQQIREVLNEKNIGKLVLTLEITLIISLVSVYVFILLLKNLEKLTKNIYTNDTPFMKENANYLNNIGYYMIFIMACNLIISFTAECLSSLDIDSGISLMSIMEILAVFVLSYVFNKGYLLESKK